MGWRPDHSITFRGSPPRKPGLTVPRVRPSYRPYIGPVSDRYWNADRTLRYHYGLSPELYWDDPITAAHFPLEEVSEAIGLAHVWEKHHVLSWLHSVGLGDIIANAKAAFEG